jgi:hypothetical protein
MSRILTFPAVIGLVFLTAACAPKVAMQNVPVSTNPIGAQVLVDGNATCTSPCNVDLPRNTNHIITLIKDGYRQHDVVIKRQYQQDKALLNAVSAGVNQGSFFNNAAWGVAAGVDSLDSQEKTGEAYILKPSAVSVKLVPQNASPDAKAQVTTSSTGGAAAATKADTANAEDEDSESLDVTKINKKKAAWGAAKIGASTMRKPGKTWNDSHESSHTSVANDGTVTKTTTKTNASVGVHVDPSAAVDLLEKAVDSAE